MHLDGTWLLSLARRAMEAAVRGQPLPEPHSESIPEDGWEPAATFVTLTREGQLRGCIGVLSAHQPLALDVIEHAQAAALHDPRFPPLSPDELSAVRVEVSVLGAPNPLPAMPPEALLRTLRPGVDGVILTHAFHRATFLPQVWEQLPHPKTFLEHLSRKAGGPSDLWKAPETRLSVYTVQAFHEPETQ